MAHTLILRPISDVALSGVTKHYAKNSSDRQGTQTNIYNYVDDINYDGGTSYAYLTTSFNGNTTRNWSYTAISAFKLGYIDSDQLPTTGKIRLNSIQVINSYLSFSHSNTSSRTNVAYFGISIDNSKYAYSSSYSFSGNSSTNFKEVDHTVSASYLSTYVGKNYDSINDLDIKLMMISYQNIQYNNN